MKVIAYIKDIFKAPSAEAIALSELEEAKRRLLKSQTSREYADSMCKFEEARIKRLTAYLHKATEE